MRFAGAPLNSHRVRRETRAMRGPGTRISANKSQAPAGLIKLDTPEIQSTSRVRSVRIGPASPHTDAAHKQIDEPANSP